MKEASKSLNLIDEPSDPLLVIINFFELSLIMYFRTSSKDFLVGMERECTKMSNVRGLSLGKLTTNIDKMLNTIFMSSDKISCIEANRIAKTLQVCLSTLTSKHDVNETC